MRHRRYRARATDADGICDICDRASHETVNEQELVHHRWIDEFRGQTGYVPDSAPDRLVARGVAHQSRARLGAAERANAATAPRARGRGSRDFFRFSLPRARRAARRPGRTQLERLLSAASSRRSPFELCTAQSLLVSSSKRTSRGASMWTSRETPPARLRPGSEAAAFRRPRFGGRRWLPFVSFQYEYARSPDARALDRSTSPVRRRSLARLPAPGRG